MPTLNWETVYDRWFALYKGEGMVIVNGLDAEMAQNRAEAMSINVEFDRTKEIVGAPAEELTKLIGKGWVSASQDF